MSMQLWCSGAAAPRGAAPVARQLEEAGWDGFQVVDSQNLSGDPYVALAMAAAATSRIGLATGVTNNVVRVAAVTACSIASVQRISNGRAALGIGRGDSALAHLGRAPSRLSSFERYLRHLQLYLKGEGVPFNEIDIPTDIAPPMSELQMADAPPDSRIAWIASAGPKVPVEVAASGPRVIAIAALHADRVMFALGADEDRLAWGIDLARKTRKEAGLDPDAMKFGAYITCGCGPDMTTAQNIVRGALTTMARFSVMHGKANGPVSEKDKAVLLDLRNSYDMRHHTRGDSPQAKVLTPEFISRFAVVGTPDAVTDRLKRLAALGLDKLVLPGSVRGVSMEDFAASKRLIETQVLPAVRA